MIAQYCFRLPFRLVIAKSSSVLNFQSEVVDEIPVSVKFAAEDEEGIAAATASAFEPPEHLGIFVDRELGVRLSLGVAEIELDTELVSSDPDEPHFDAALQALNNLITRLRVAGRVPSPIRLPLAESRGD